MSHVAFVQQGSPNEATEEPGSGVFKRGDGAPGVLVPVGVLGCDEHYTMPRGILDVLGGHLGGEVTTDLPPFLIACSDGFVLVMTLLAGADFMGCAFLIPRERLEVIDRQIADLWSRVDKAHSAAEFLEGTAFACLGRTTSLPAALERGWANAFC